MSDPREVFTGPWFPDSQCRKADFTEWVNQMDRDRLQQQIRVTRGESRAARRAGKPDLAANYDEQVLVCQARLQELPGRESAR